MNDAVKILFVGDLFLGNGEVELSNAVLERFSQADCVVGNLESPITSKALADSSKILLRSQCGLEENLKEWGINIVSLANNHSHDCGDQGLLETWQRLVHAGIEPVGAGKDLSESKKALIVTVRGVQIGFIACAWDGTEAVNATSETAGCAPLDVPVVSSQIQCLKLDGVDHVVVMPHWGYCDYAFPPDFNVITGESILDAGASAVVGHHSHIVQGCRQRDDGRMIAYSLGNFLFARYLHKGHTIQCAGEGAKGVILKLELDQTRLVNMEVIFTRQMENVVEIENTQERGREFEQRCAPFSSVDNYHAFWRRQTQKRLFRRVVFWANPWRWRKLNSSTFTGLVIMLANSIKWKRSP